MRDLGPAGRPTIRRLHYDVAFRPFLVIWEVTGACDLACRHCRAQATPDRDPRELTTEEGFDLMHQITAFGAPRPLFVLTGGDPFKRSDLFELVRYGAHIGLPISVAPSGTRTLTVRNLQRLRKAGAVAISLSLDGSTDEVHDAFRGVRGTFRWTLAACRRARMLGFKLQVNSMVTPENLHDLPDLVALVRSLGAMTWSVFFLVPTGRGRELPQLSPQEVEDVLNFLYDAGKIVSLKTTEAPHYRRVVVQRRILERQGTPPEGPLHLGDTYRALASRLRELFPEQGGPLGEVRRVPLDVSAARGFVFVSRVGDVHPSGFLPLSAGNVREKPLLDLYRKSPLFRRLRDPDRLSGRCGRCEFRAVCGGSRSRAFAVSGDPCAEEPSCVYTPGSFPFQTEIGKFLGAA